MKKLLTLIIFTSCIGGVWGQKVNDSTYKNVISVDKYDDAQVLTYRGKNGKVKSDTMFYKKQKFDINIESSEVVNIYDKKITKPIK